jgi:hypothetical protein
MQQYYKGSSANIIAAAAKNPACGIFDSADRFRVGRTYSMHTNYYDYPVNVSFVEKRA